uniref:Uncharacterized protein n=1 Tax=viral metagenome TaxID=1070528 RepID=A0A6C0J3C8_9ZZZZ
MSSNIINEIFNNLFKFDTSLAFIVSLYLFYNYSKNIHKSLLFSFKFVLIFLVLLNLLKN